MIRWMERLSQGAYNHPWLTITVLSIVLAMAGWGITRLRLDNSNESFFMEGEPVVKEYDRFQEVFGSDEFVYLLLDYGQEKFFSKPENLRLLADLTTELGRIEYEGRNLVDEVLSLANADRITGLEGELNVAPLIDLDHLPVDLSLLEQAAMEEPLYANSLVSKDGTKVGILVDTIRLKGDGRFRKVIDERVREIISDPKYDGIRIKAVGIPILDAAVDNITSEQMVLFLSLAVVINALVLGLIFRSWSGVVAPMAVVLTSLISVLGLMSLLKIPVTIVSTVIPPLLIAVSTGAVVHLLHEFKGQRETPRKEAFKRSVTAKIGPCFFTTITTMAGFLSLTTARVRPVRQLGVSAAIGVILAYLLTFTIAPIFFRRMKISGAAVVERKGQKRLFLSKLGVWVTKNPWLILLSGIALTSIFLCFIPKIVVESNFIKIFKPSVRIRQDVDIVDRTMGGSNSIEIVIDTGQVDGVKDPEFLRRVVEYQKALNADHLVVKTLSLADLAQRIHQALNNNQPEFYKIPREQGILREELFLYELSKEDAFFGLSDEEFRRLRITVWLKNTGTAEFNQLTKWIKAEAERFFGKTRGLTVTGTVPIFLKMAEYITLSQLWSFLIAFGAIALMMILAVGSIPLGLISMIPNLIPVLIMFGFMGIARIPLDFVTVLTCSIAIGVAVDNTIHLITRAKQEIRRGADADEATQQTIQSVGSAVISSSLSLGTGFLVMSASQVTSIANFGILSALTVLAALIADLLITPSLMALYFSKRRLSYSQ